MKLDRRPVQYTGGRRRQLGTITRIRCQGSATVIEVLNTASNAVAVQLQRAGIRYFIIIALNICQPKNSTQMQKMPFSAIWSSTHFMHQQTTIPQACHVLLRSGRQTILQASADDIIH
jgi:hypothetical protein